MAELAFGISMKAIEEVAKKVKSAIKEEAEQRQILQRDLVFMKDEFEMMQSFLGVADREHIRNNVVKTWVRQVRDMSYDAEDSIELVLHLDTKRPWLLRVCRRLWFSLLSACMLGAAQPLDTAVAEIKLLKAQVEEVSQRNIRYNLIGDTRSKPAGQMQPTTAASTRKLDILVKARDAAKEQSSFSDLVELITNGGCDLQMMSVCGTGDDIGTISILKTAYDDPEIYSNFTCRAWVKLMHPFNPREFMGSLVAQFYSNSCQKEGKAIIDLDVLKEMDAKQGADLAKELVGQINNQRYLVVVEDLCSMAEWHSVRMYLPDVMNGSRIVVLTQQLEIASSCTGQPYQVLELKQYSENHSVWVFFKKGLQRDGVRSLRPEGSTVNSDMGVRETQKASLTVDGFHLVGRDSLVRDLSNLISSRRHTDGPRVVSAWGFAGAGKSALVRTVYDRCVKEKTFYKVSWVDASSHPFNLMGFSRSVLIDTGSRSLLRVTDPIQECRQVLHENRCLLVIDGLQFKEDWDSINSELISGPSGSKLTCIIVTRQLHVACHAAKPNDAVRYVPGLQDDATLHLFKQVLWQNASIVRRDMIEVAKHFLPKCGGLPRVIIAIVSHLVPLVYGNRETLEREWRSLISEVPRLRETDTESDSLRDLFDRMHSCFHDCPQYLKKFIFYLSVFPEGTIIRRRRLVRRTIIRRRRLVRRWMAEGYFKGTDSHSLEEEVEKLIHKLADIHVIQAPQATTVAGGMRMTSYQVDPLFLNYIISRETDESIFLPLEVSVLEEESRLNTERIGQHLAIRKSWKADRLVFDSLNFTRLRSLTVSGPLQPFFISGNMKVLRVLDLENAENVTDENLDRIGKLTPRLKFLSLRECKGITRLPDSVSDLNQLQTLDIRGTSIMKLPKCIIKLHKLQYIRAGSTVPWMDDHDGLAAAEPSSSWTHTIVPCLPRLGRCSCCSRNGGVEVPRGIQHLTALQTLGAVNVDTAEGAAILEEIRSLEQLNKLQVSGINRKNSRTFNYVVKFLPHLESLSLQLEKENNVVGWNHIDPPLNIRSLKLYGPVQVLPAEWFRLLGNLMKLSLDMTTLFTPEVIQDLGSLQSLHTLRLRVKTDQDGELQFPSALFSKLQVLEIACKSRLLVRFDEETMDKLEQLKVHCCRGSTLQFSELRHLISLKHVWLLGSYDDTLKEALRQQLDMHPKKPALELEEPISSS